MTNQLEIAIPDFNPFYSLYADGRLSWKTYDRRRKASLLYYLPGAAVILYYTYRTYREACVIRNVQNENSAALPGLSKKVDVLFRVRASRVDKLRRAAGWLNAHSAGAFAYGDGFYTRLAFILERRGKINYPALRALAENSKTQN